MKSPAAEPRPEAGNDAPALESFLRMTPEEREKELEKLPSDRREKLQRQLQRYDRMSPAERERLEWFRQLPPERQEAFRKAYQKFQRQPPERKQAIRDALVRLRGMPDAQRQAYVSSPAVKSNFNKNEQQILEQLSGILPHNE